MGCLICRRRVVGVSLAPAIKPGQKIVFVGWKKPRVGRLVLARVEGREVIKLVTAQKRGLLWLAGSLDGSANYQVEAAAIIGVAVGYNNAYESTRRPAG